MQDHIILRMEVEDESGSRDVDLTVRLPLASSVDVVDSAIATGARVLSEMWQRTSKWEAATNAR